MNFNLKNQMPKEVENFKKIIKGKLKDYIDRDYNSMEEMDQKDIVAQLSRQKSKIFIMN